MTITRHPDISTLMTCAAGSQPEVLCAVVASHLAMCPECMGELKRLEKIGVALFEGLPPTLMPAGLKSDVDRFVDHANAGDVAGRVLARGDVPAPLVAVLGESLDKLDWAPLSAGVWHYQVPLTPGAKGDLRLLKLSPGAAVPEHTHQGEELSVVLCGSYSDRFGTFHRGDFADLDDQATHDLIADGNKGCVLLVGSEHQPEFVLKLAS